MPIHDWTRAPPGYFHHFHQYWSVSLCTALNAGLLPKGLFALVEQQRGGLGVSVEDEAYAAKANRIVVRASGGRVVAVVEIVSPGNKHSAHALRFFVDKALEFLAQGVHLLIVDLFPPSARDPDGMHAVIWDELSGQRFDLPPDKPLTLASYVATVPKKAYVEVAAVGDALPEMPLFIDAARYVHTPLERTYQEAWNLCPPEFKEGVTG